MKTLSAITAILLATTSYAMAEGALQLYNWGNYTSPELLAKFEAETGIKVTVTDYDSNDTALAKIEAGASLVQLYTAMIYKGPGLFGEITEQAAHSGIGAALLSSMTVELREEGHVELCSDARLENLASHQAHAAWGFAETQRVVYFRKPL